MNFLSKTYLTLVGLALVMPACSKEEFVPQPKPGDADPSKVVDSAYNNFSELLGDVTTYSSLRQFFEQQTWKTLYDRTYSIILPADTIFTKDRMAGMQWTFYFYNFPPQPEFHGSIIQQIKNGDMAVTFSIENEVFKIDNYPYQIVAPTLYTDSTFSFLLQRQEVADSVTRIASIKLQSYH